MVKTRNLVYRILDDQFVDAVKTAKSWVQVCRNLSIQESYRKSVKKRAIKMNLDIEHLSDNIPIEKLKSAVLSSCSFTEAQEKLQISPRYLRKLVLTHKISTHHFKRNISTNTKLNITKEELLKVIGENRFVLEILTCLGLCQSKENIKWLRVTCNRFGIDLSRNQRIKWTSSPKEIEKNLSNKVYSPYISKNLIKYGLKKNECELCGQKPWHNGKVLILQCHHINGDRTDNTLKNLQILCPNCHTQTDNYSKSKVGNS